MRITFIANEIHLSKWTPVETSTESHLLILVFLYRQCRDQITYLHSYTDSIDAVLAKYRYTDIAVSRIFADSHDSTDQP